jgi:HK97 family phage portal protein
MFKKWFKNYAKKNSNSGVVDNTFGAFIRLGDNGQGLTQYDQQAKTGYSNNVIAYLCVSRIAQAIGAIPFILKINRKEIDQEKQYDDSLLRALNRPNPKQSYNTWMREMVIHRLISGNNYIYFNVASVDCFEMSNFRPDRVTIKTSSGVAVGYEYRINSESHYFPIDLNTNESDVLQMKEINPLDDLYGLSPIQVAASSVQQHNASGEWNKNLLLNGARPSGALSLKNAENMPSLGDEERNRIQQTINEKYTGAANAGRIIFIDQELKFDPFTFSPTDMDWINGKNTTARDICLAFGYPAHLLGLPDSSTYNNVAEAKEDLYIGKIIPLAEEIFSALSHYLTQRFGKQIDITIDEDGIAALSRLREMARDNALKALNGGMITLNEARWEVGYDRVDNGDEVMVPAGKLPLNFDAPPTEPPKKSPLTQNLWVFSGEF